MLPALVRDLVGMGPIGYVLLGAPVVALVASVVALAARGPLGRTGCATAVSALAIAMVAAWAAVHGSRARFVEEVLHPDRMSPAWPSLTLARGIVAEHAGAGTALVLVPLVAAAVAVTWTRGTRGLRVRALAAALATAIGLPAWIAACASFATSGALLSVSWEECDAQCRYDAAMASTAAIDAARPWLLAAGAGTAVVALLLVAMRGRAGSGRLRAAGVALGIAGIVAYASTRGLAEDAAHPVSFEEPSSSMATDVDALPVSLGPCAPVDGVLVEVSREGRVWVDGAGTASAGSLLGAKRSVWLRVHPGQSFDVPALIAAPADLPASRAMAAVASAREAGYPRVFAATARPVPAAASRTLGSIARPARLCTAPVVEGDAGATERWVDRVGHD